MKEKSDSRQRAIPRRSEGQDRLAAEHKRDLLRLDVDAFGDRQSEQRGHIRAFDES